MKHEFANILELFRAVENGFDVCDREGAFVNKEHWKESPSETQFIFFDEDDIYDDDDAEYEEDESGDGWRPRVAVELGIDYLLIGPNLVDIFEVMKRQGKEMTLENIVRAVDYYREMDCFEPL